MKSTILILAIALSAAYGLYVHPAKIQRRLSSDREVYRGLAEFFNQLGVGSKAKRCANTFDEGCAIGNIPGAAADEAWLVNTPGKRCANLYDESCVNGGLDVAGNDEDWLTGGNNPGRR